MAAEAKSSYCRHKPFTLVRKKYSSLGTRDTVVGVRSAQPVPVRPGLPGPSTSRLTPRSFTVGSGAVRPGPGAGPGTVTTTRPPTVLCTTGRISVSPRTPDPHPRSPLCTESPRPGPGRLVRSSLPGSGPPKREGLLRPLRERCPHPRITPWSESVTLAGHRRVPRDSNTILEPGTSSSPEESGVGPSRRP